MDESFLQFKAHNESKNIFKAARTPAVFFAIAVTMYILSGIFGLVGLYTIANVCNLIMGIGLLTLVLWAYIRQVKNYNVHEIIFDVSRVVVLHFISINVFFLSYLGIAVSSGKSARR